MLMPYAAADDGSPIHYRLEGPQDAPVVMLSNALGVDLAMWEAQLPALNDVRLLRYDTRGHGRSGAPAGEYSLDQLGRDALAVLDAVGAQQAVFCGLSMGGAVGQWLAIHAPERLKGLVLASTAAVFGTPEVWRQRIEAVTRDGVAPLVPGILERWFTAGYRQREPAQVARIEAMLTACPAIGYAGCCAALRDIDLRTELRRIATPTLVIGGSSDPGTPPERVTELAAGIKGARLTMLDAAHLSNIEQAADFNTAVRTFLATLR